MLDAGQAAEKVVVVVYGLFGLAETMAFDTLTGAVIVLIGIAQLGNDAAQLIQLALLLQGGLAVLVQYLQSLQLYFGVDCGNT